MDKVEPVEFSGMVGSVADLLVAIEKLGFMDTPHAHARIWFRGEPDVSFKLAPGVYRENHVPDEDARLSDECHLTQDFRAMAAGLLKGNETEAEIYFLQQHYKMPTRLLDWSTNAQVGLYFAAQPISGKVDADGSIYVMDAYRLLETQRKNVRDTNGNGPTGLMTSRNPIFLGHGLKPIFQWGKKEEFFKHIIPVRPDFRDTRIRHQRGCFTFHVPEAPTLLRVHNPSLHRFRIPKDAKQEILKQLSVLGMDDFAIYNDLEHLATKLRRAYRL